MSTTPSGLSKVAPTGLDATVGAGGLDVGEPVVATVRRVHPGMVEIVGGHLVAFDPGTEMALLERHVVLGLAGAHAVAAADALLDVDDHSPPVIREAVVGRRLGLARDDGVPCERGCPREQQQPAGVGEEGAAILFHDGLL
jgi:hypothetical protein